MKYSSILEAVHGIEGRAEELIGIQKSNVLVCKS